MRTRDATYRQRLPRNDISGDYIRLSGFYELNQREGYEVLVNTWNGASSVFYVALTLADGELQLLVDDMGAPVTMAAAGSVGNGGAVDCAGTKIVLSGFGIASNGKHFNVTRRFFTPDGATLLPAGTEEHRVPTFEDMSEFAEFTDLEDAPFAHCPRPPKD